MAVKIYYIKEDDGYDIIVYDSPAWLYHDPKPHPYHAMATDIWAKELDNFHVKTLEDVFREAKGACDFYAKKAHGVDGKEERPPVKREDRLYSVRTPPQNEDGSSRIDFRGDIVDHQSVNIKEREIPGYVEKRFGIKGFKTDGIEKLEWGDNANYGDIDEDICMSVVRVNDRKKKGLLGRFASKDQKSAPVPRCLKERAVKSIVKAIDNNRALNNNVYSMTAHCTRNGNVCVDILLNGGTFFIPAKMDEWDAALSEYCEYFDIVNGEMITLYNIKDSYLKKGGSLGGIEFLYQRSF